MGFLRDDPMDSIYERKTYNPEGGDVLYEIAPDEPEVYNEEPSGSADKADTGSSAEVTDVTDVTGVNEVSDATDVTGVTEVSDATDVTGVTEVSDVTDVTGVNDVSDVTDNTEASDSSSASYNAFDNAVSADNTDAVYNAYDANEPAADASGAADESDANTNTESSYDTSFIDDNGSRGGEEFDHFQGLLNSVRQLYVSSLSAASDAKDELRSEYKDAIREKDATIDDLNDRIRNLENRYERAVSETAELKEALDKAKGELKDAIERAELSEGQLQAKENAYILLENEKRNATERANKFSKEVSGLSVENSELDKTNKRLRRELDEKNAKITAYASENEELKKAIANVRSLAESDMKQKEELIKKSVKLDYERKLFELEKELRDIHDRKGNSLGAEVNRRRDMGKDPLSNASWPQNKNNQGNVHNINI